VVFLDGGGQSLSQIFTVSALQATSVPRPGPPPSGLLPALKVSPLKKAELWRVPADH
jgi:hypothetical protein